MSSWQAAVFITELKRQFSYRVDFWMRYFIALLVQFVVAVFLWAAVYKISASDTLAGLSLTQMLQYTFVAVFVFEIAIPEISGVASDIYDGSLSRYLVYPLSFISYKLIAHLARAALLAVPFALALLAAQFGFLPFHLTATALLQGSIAVFLASTLYFVLTLTFEYAAFWADSIWTLVVMLRFMVALLGGKMLPIALFPQALQPWVENLPFASIISFPAQAFLGHLSWTQFFSGCLLSSAWITVIAAGSHVVWSRGMRNYSGVGM